mmetsp:Transcript_46541/g.68787  ORF Transcript_46541/g.68787 Transcript_46541/m.68787 type:complete len:187 (+) Transcript_46541:2-562(+)
MSVNSIFLSCLLLTAKVFAFSPSKTPFRSARFGVSSSGPEGLSTTALKAFDFSVQIPPKDKGLVAQIACEPVLEVPSEIIEVRYKVPFGLNVEPKGGLAVCTKEGPGGEKPGDVLRYSSQWTMGLPRGDGVVSTVASFGGGISWQCSLFDVVRAKAWEEVIEALTSNVEQRTDEVVLIFERALPAE